MHNIGSLGLVYWDDPEGWYGEGPLTAGGRILIRMVPTVVLPVAQLGGLHAGLVPATVVPPGAVCLGGWGQG